MTRRARYCTAEQACRSGRVSLTSAGALVSTVLLLSLAQTGLAQPLLEGETRSTLVVDQGGDGAPSVGDVVEVEITVQSSGSAAAPAGIVSIDVDRHAALIPGSLNVSPIVQTDSFAGVGNVELTINAPSGLLVNDHDPDGDTFSVTAYDGTTALGGTVSVAPDGSFTYRPARGVSGGTDSFAYTVTDARGLSARGRVEIPLTGRVWFVDSRASSSGSGESHAPYSSLNPFIAGPRPDLPGDIILLRSGGAAYDAGVTLLQGEELVGDAIGLTVGGVAVVPASGQRPILQSFGGTAVQLATGAAVRSVSITAGGTDAIAGAGLGGTISVENVSIAAAGTARALVLSGTTGSVVVKDSMIAMSGTGDGVTVSGGVPSIVIHDCSIAAGAGRTINIAGLTGGSVTVTTTTAASTTGGGVRVANVGAATIDLEGFDVVSNASFPALALEGPVGALVVNQSEFAASGRDVVTFTAVTGSVDLEGTDITVSGAPLRIDGFSGDELRLGDVTVTPIGTEALIADGTSGAVSIRSLLADMSSSTAPGIRIEQQTGSISVDGGTISGVTSGNAVELRDAEEISFANFTIDGGFGGLANGIVAERTAGLALTNSVITRIGDNDSGTSAAGTESAILATHLSGAVTLTEVVIDDIGRDAVLIDNDDLDDPATEELLLILDESLITRVNEFAILLTTFSGDQTSVAIRDSIVVDVGSPSRRAITLLFEGALNELQVEGSAFLDTGSSNLFVRAEGSATLDAHVLSSTFDTTTDEAVFLRATGQPGAPAGSRAAIVARIDGNSFGTGVGREGIYADALDDGASVSLHMNGNIDLGAAAGFATVVSQTSSSYVCLSPIANVSPGAPGFTIANGGVFELQSFVGSTAADAEGFLESGNSLDASAFGTFGSGTCAAP